jgi:hypothetical protein
LRELGLARSPLRPLTAALTAALPMLVVFAVFLRFNPAFTALAVWMTAIVKGGHAFGLRRTESPITGWPELVETWLGTIGMISR